MQVRYDHGSNPETYPVLLSRYAWGLLRLPLAAAVLYLLREPLLAWLEPYFGLSFVTLFVIDVASTPLARALCFVAVALPLTLALVASRSILGRQSWLPMLGAGILAFAVLALVTHSSLIRVLPAIALLITNLGEDAILARLFTSARSLHRLFLWGIGTEVLFLGRFLRWLGTPALDEGLPGKSDILNALPGVALASGVAVFCVYGQSLVPLEQALRMPDTVRIIDHADFNGIAVDASHRYLFATGHGLSRLRRYDLDHPTAPPIESDEPTGASQGLEYDPAAGEIFLHNATVGAILVFDKELRFLRGVPAPELSRGDAWITVDVNTGTITIVSEADEQRGTPFLVLDRTTGAVIDRRGEEAGNVLLDPARSWLYLSFFRRTSKLMTYDLVQRRIIRTTPTEPRLDRMVLWRASNEVLAASPLNARILRFDAESLNRKGSFPSIFGVRTLAIDEQREIVLCGSLATGKIAVLDLHTGRERASFYLGPRIRTIAVVPQRGVAYVSSNGALYELRYDSTDRVTP